MDTDVPYLFYAVRCADMAAFDAALADDPSVTNPVTIVDGDGERLYRIEPTPEFMLVPEVTRLGGARLDALCRDGTWSGRVQLPDREALAALHDYAEDHGATFEVRGLYRADAAGGWGDAGLTDAQREALLAAFEAGYFDTPRTATLEDLAGTLGISSTAVGRRLRRGTAHLVETVLRADR